MNTPENPQPFLSLHTAVVLLIAFVIGIVLGALTVFSGAPMVAAVAVGITGAGGSIPALRSLIR